MISSGKIEAEIAPIVKRIERSPPKRQIQVRFLVGAQKTARIFRAALNTYFQTQNYFLNESSS